MAQLTIPSAALGSRAAAWGPGGSAVRTRSGWAALLATMTARGALLVLVGLLLWSVVPSVFGWSSTVVMSNSMAPKLFTGDVVLVRPVSPDEVAVGQILLVDDPDHPDRLRLHRLTAVDRRTGDLTLKGDANARADSTVVHPDALHGVGALRVPWVGSPMVWWQEGRIRLVGWSVVGVAALAVGLWSYRPSPGTECAPAELSRRSSPAPAARRRRVPPFVKPTQDPGEERFRGLYERTDTAVFLPVVVDPEQDRPRPTKADLLRRSAPDRPIPSVRPDGV